MADITDGGQQYAAGQHPDLPPPPGTVGVVGWIRQNLFPNWTNAILTLLSIWLLWITIPPSISWLFLDADFAGASRDECAGGGACWAVIRARFDLYMYGFYPDAEQWRANLAGVLLIFALIPVLFENIPYRKFGLLFSAIYPAIAFFLLFGGLGLEEVGTHQWGGLLLTLVVGFTGIFASLPIGIVLALGRRSKMPIVKYLCIGFIEFVRGVPLITILFMASVMLPLFLPPGVNFDKVMRVLIGVSLFSSAYMAETIRGGLQAIPKGQYEAAEALGLSYWKSMGLIILPQALKIVIPGIVNTFIGLFDVLGVARQAVQSAEWMGLGAESYIFTAFLFFIFCFSMSRYSIWLEGKLETGHKR